MGTNCLTCQKRPRTGMDALCNYCRAESKLPKKLALPQVRASSMKLAVECSASMNGRGDEVMVDASDATAATGTNVHRAIAMTLMGEEWPPFTGDDAAVNEGLVQRADEWFNSNISLFGGEDGDAEFEVRLTHEWLSGTIDVLAFPIRTRATVVDWKTTFREDDHEAQLLAYAWLVFKNFSDVDQVLIITAFLRHNTVETKVLTRQYVVSWMEEFVANNLNHRDIFRAGEHCGRCRRFATCPALVVLNRKTVADLMEMQEGPTPYLNREVGAELWARVRLLESTIETFRNFMRETVKREGTISLPSGKLLKAINIRKTTILPLQAWHLLETTFSEGELAEILTVPKTALEQAIGKKAEKGMKKKNVEAFLARLDQAGALAVRTEIQVKEASAKEIDDG